MMTGRNVRSRNEPARIRKMAIIRKIRLKYVQTLLFTISAVVLDGRLHRAVGPAVLAVLGNLLGGKAFGRVCLITRRWNTAVNDFGNCFVHNSYIPLRLF